MLLKEKELKSYNELSEKLTLLKAFLLSLYDFSINIL